MGDCRWNPECVSAPTGQDKRGCTLPHTSVAPPTGPTEVVAHVAPVPAHEHALRAVDHHDAALESLLLFVRVDHGQPRNAHAELQLLVPWIRWILHLCLPLRLARVAQRRGICRAQRNIARVVVFRRPTRPGGSGPRQECALLAFFFASDEGGEVGLARRGS